MLYPNLNIFGIKCDVMYNAKEQCQCVSILIPLKTEWLSKRSGNNMKDILGINIAYWRVYVRWGTWNKTRKIRFSAKVDI